MTNAARLLHRLKERSPVLLPGVCDAFGGMMAERAGFEAAYLSGASLSHSLLGRPDIGLTDANDVVSAAQRICDRISTPLVVDADTGYGGVLNVEQTVRRFASAGVAGVQLEDQEFPKRCGHLAGKTLVSTGEMVAKLRAALAARGPNGPLIIARTDAIAVEGLEAACERAENYVKAGIDALFIEAPEDKLQIRAISDRFASRVPLVLNQVEGGRTPLLELEECAELGIGIILVPGGLLRAVAHTMERYFTSLRATGSNAAFRKNMLDFGELNEILGTEAELARATRYATEMPREQPDKKNTVKFKQ